MADDRAQPTLVVLGAAERRRQNVAEVAVQALSVTEGEAQERAELLSDDPHVRPAVVSGLGVC